MRTIEHRDIVCISGVDWDPYWTRKQQLMSRFPRSNRIVYVEPPISLLSPFKDPALWSKYGTWREGLRRHTEFEHIYLYSPPPFLPFANQVSGLGLNILNQRILAADLRAKLKQLSFHNPLLITYLPNSVDLLGHLGEQLVVYDVVDDHTEFQGFNSEVVWAMEKRLLRRADVTFATSQALYDDRKEFAREIHLLGNAAEFDFFQQALTGERPKPPELEGLKHPVIGFVGRIKEWIDLELVADVARERPDWSFLMIGPVESDANMAVVEGLENVHFIGMRPRGTLPGYLRYCDVGINPFRRTRLSRAVNPLKLY